MKYSYGGGFTKKKKLVMDEVKRKSSWSPKEPIWAATLDFGLGTEFLAHYIFH